MKKKIEDKRLLNEILHGKRIFKVGDHIWNWSSPAGQIRKKRRAQMFIDFIGNKKRKVLEIGCGTGLFTKEIAKTNNAIFAIDISGELLNLAKKRVSQKNVIFKLTNAYKTNFKNNFFDYIVGSSVLHHLDLQLSLKEFYRILKPGGRIIFTEPNMLNPQVALERNIPFIRKLANNSPDETAFLRWTLKKEFINIGFTRVCINPFDFLHPLVPSCFLNFAVPFLRIPENLPLIKEFAGSLLIKAKK